MAVRDHHGVGGIEGTELDSETKDRLVNMVAAALRRNPRRIKQFINNLEARLRTIRARERSGRIAPPISQDVLGIAKVAIIEEEWRSEYEELEADPHRLSEWQATVIASDLPNEELTAFLRTTRDIVPLNVSAILNLKLEVDDLLLPDLPDYREAVAYGDFARARRIVEQAGDEDRAAYGERLPDLMRRELGAGRIAQARNVLDAALQDTPLGLSADLRRVVVSDSLAHPLLVAQLPSLEASRVFAALELMAPAERQLGRAPFIELSNVATQGEDTLRSTGQELAKRVRELSPAERSTLQGAATLEPGATQVRPAFLVVAEADPTLVTEQIGAGAFQALPGGDLTTDDTNLRLYLLGPAQGIGLPFAGALLDRARSQLVDSLGDEGRALGTADLIEAVLRSLRVDVEPAVELLLGSVADNLPSIIGRQPRDRWLLWLIFVSSTPDRFDSSVGAVTAAENIARALTEQALLEVAAVVASGHPGIGEIGEKPKAMLMLSFAQHLQSLAPDNAEWSTIAEAACSLDNEAGSDLIRDEAIRRLSGGQVIDSGTIVSAFRDALKERDATIVEAVGPAIASGVVSALDGYRFVVAIAGGATKVGKASADSVLASTLLEMDRAQAEAARTALEEQEADQSGASFVTDLRSKLVAALPSTFDDARLPALKYLVSVLRDLSPENGRRIRQTIAAWLDESPDFAREVSDAIRPYEATADDRLSVVRAFLRAARTAENAEWRADALLAAVEVAGKSRPALRQCREVLELMAATPDPIAEEAARLSRERLQNQGLAL